jgi:glutamate formiminotransferase
VGARVPLVAFNAYLTAAEADAKEIARAIRGSSGGLPALRAIGFLVPERGCSTVSMNLVDYTTTGVRAAYDAVVAQAEARGAEVLDTEIVGLVPEAALSPEDAEYVRLLGFDREAQVLERLIEEAS